ncbi:complement factor H isoform X2 [Ictalurus furcatus]|nr:complement factor H isoform X2 [Ictalurus furcatus]
MGSNMQVAVKIFFFAFGISSFMLAENQATVITCLLGSPTTGVVSTKPIGKNIFLAGEYVEIICSKKYWIFGTKQVSRNIKCQEDGKWEFRPVCEEITCEYPRGEHLLNNPSYYKHIYKLGENTWYRCEYGYQRTAASITCTENGWEPEPRCIEITCQKPEIAHGEVMGIQKNTYNRNVKIELKCNQGYEPKRFLVTCNQNGEWDNMQQCTLVKCPIISNLGDVIAKGNTEEASYGDVIHFECASHDKMLEGAEEIHCKDDGQWSDKKPKCIEKTTCAGASVENVFTHKLPGGFSYSCHANYKAFDEKWWGVVICTEGPQSYAPLCIPNDQCGQIPNVHAKKIQVKKGYKNEETVEFECESKPCCFKCISGTWQDCQCIPPSVENAVITSHSQHQVEYTCRNNYTITGKRLISCNSSQWKELPTCKSTVITCPLGSPTTGVVSTKPIGKNIFLAGEYVEIICSKKYWIFGTKQVSRNIKCQEDGKWEFRPVCEEITCEYPRREHLLNNPSYYKHIYKLGENTWYRCEYGYQRTAASITCTENGWEPEPRCIEITCQKPEIAHGEVMGIQKNTYNRNVKIELKCNQGYEPKRFLVTCNQNGEWDNMQQCTSTVITCPLGSPTTGVVSTKPIGKNIFLAGEYVEIICSKKYWIFGTKQVSRNIKCQEDGKWEFRPVCEEITCEYPRGEHLLNNPSYYKHIYKLGENTWYRCEYGYQRTAASITCTENGWEPEPRCIEITCQKPEIAHGEVMGIQKNTYNRNVKIELKCNQGYEPKRFLVTCNQNGEWDNMQQCTLVKCPIISNLGDVITTGNTEEARYGDFIRFKCASPNKMLEGPEEIHCKDDGQWSDKIPKCKEKTTCAGASVQNGFTNKLPGGFSYSCHANYKAFDEKWWGVVICTEGPQSYAPLCIPNDQCGQIPNVHAKKIQVKKGYKNEETVEFECESKPCCFKCISGTWQDCQCIPPSVENAVITSHSQHQVEYTCRNNYTITGKRLISCNSSQWKELPTCK